MTLKKKLNKRINDSDAEKLFKIQNHLYEFVNSIKIKFLDLKLELGESQVSKQVLQEIKSINCRLTTLGNSMNGKNDSPTPSFTSSQIKPTWVAGKTTLAVSNTPISSPSLVKPNFVYANKFFQNSIIFENVFKPPLSISC